MGNDDVLRYDFIKVVLLKMTDFGVSLRMLLMEGEGQNGMVVHHCKLCS